MDLALDRKPADAEAGGAQLHGTGGAEGCDHGAAGLGQRLPTATPGSSDRAWWLGLVIPIEYVARRIADGRAVLFEELGRGPRPGTVLQLGRTRGPDRAARGYRGPAAHDPPRGRRGRQVLTRGDHGAGAPHGTSWSAVQAGAPCGNYVLNGTKLFVADAWRNTPAGRGAHRQRRTRHQPAGGRYVEAGVASAGLPGFLSWQASDFQGRRGVGRPRCSRPREQRLGRIEQALEQAIPGAVAPTRSAARRRCSTCRWRTARPASSSAYRSGDFSGCRITSSAREPAGLGAGRRTTRSGSWRRVSLRVRNAYGQGRGERGVHGACNAAHEVTPASAPRASTAWWHTRRCSRTLFHPRRPQVAQAPHGRRVGVVEGGRNLSGHVAKQRARRTQCYAIRFLVRRHEAASLASVPGREASLPIAVNLRAGGWDRAENQRVRLGAVGGRERGRCSSTQRWARALTLTAMGRDASRPAGSFQASDRC